MFKKLFKMQWVLLAMFATMLPLEAAFAHGERAQQAGLRMRTMNWFDVQISPVNVQVNDVVTIRGKFNPSTWWPDHMASIEESAFLNVGVAGPAFVRIDSRVNGVPMIRSTHFDLGKTYEFEIKIKARAPGRYHAHPVMSIEGAGPIIGPGTWLEVGGSQDDFVNTVETLTGETIDLETVGLTAIIWTHSFWLVVGIAWLFYWFRKTPVIMPRYNKIVEEGEARAGELITMQDMVVSFVFFVFTLVAITGGYFWAQNEYPITTPLQTSKVDVPNLPDQEHVLDIKVIKATYRIPGRSFKLDLDVTNLSDRTLRVGEFSTANIRFINKDVQPGLTRVDKQDLIAPDGLVVEGGAILPGQTTTISVYADDALWETYRLTSLIYDPDSRFAGMLFFFDENGERFHYEVGGAMLPEFS